MPDEPTLWELGRRIDSLRTDIATLSQRFDQYVLKEVYDANRRALLERLTRMEEDRKRVEADLQHLKDTSRSTWRWVITSFLSPIVVGIVLAWMLGGGP